MLGTAVALTAVFALAGAAPAADPMPCRGVSFTDKDDTVANRNIREGWFAFSGGRLTANLRLEQVDQQLETGNGTATFAMYYNDRRVARYAAAITDGSTWRFEYGNDSGSTVPAKPTSGAVKPGPNGVIEIEIPSEHAREHDTVRGIHARSFVRDAAGFTGSQKDGAPDSSDPQKFGGYGADFLVESCPPGSPEPEPPPEPLPSPDPPPGPPAGPDPPPGPSVTPPGGPFKVTVPRLRARSLTPGRSFRVTVDPAEPLKALVIKLHRNGRVVARGRRPSLTRAAAVKVRVTRRITKGTHKLTVRGRTPDGERATRAVTVRVE